MICAQFNTKLFSKDFNWIHTAELLSIGCKFTTYLFQLSLSEAWLHYIYYSIQWLLTEAKRKKVQLRIENKTAYKLAYKYSSFNHSSCSIFIHVITVVPKMHSLISELKRKSFLRTHILLKFVNIFIEKTYSYISKFYHIKIFRCCNFSKLFMKHFFQMFWKYIFLLISLLMFLAYFHKIFDKSILKFLKNDWKESCVERFQNLVLKYG